jgi:hypothetical protein
MFVDGRRHGEGALFYANGARYEGCWMSDKKHGHGVYYFEDGSVFEGQWVDDRPVLATATKDVDGSPPAAEQEAAPPGIDGGISQPQLKQAVAQQSLAMPQSAASSPSRSARDTSKGGASTAQQRNKLASTGPKGRPAKASASAGTPLRAQDAAAASPAAVGASSCAASSVPQAEGSRRTLASAGPISGVAGASPPPAAPVAAGPAMFGPKSSTVVVQIGDLLEGEDNPSTAAKVAAWLR